MFSVKCFTFNFITFLYAKDLHGDTKYDENYGMIGDDVDQRNVLAENPLIIAQSINWNNHGKHRDHKTKSRF